MIAWSVIWFLIKLFFFVNWSYIALMAAKSRRAMLGKYWTPIVYVLAIPAYVGDILFNAFFGTVIFGEWPKEWVFTKRVQRHVDESKPGGRDYRRALWWAVTLNVFDDHITLVASDIGWAKHYGYM